MADTKISAAGDAGVLISTDMVPLARSGNVSAFRATMSEVATYTSAAAPVQSVATRTGAVTLTHSDITDWAATLSPYALLASPTFTGTPSLPTGTTGVTQTAGTSNTTLATTAFVGTALGNYAPLASPVFTGDARAVTPAYGDNDTSISTTAYVQSAVAPAFNDVGRNAVTNGTFVVWQRGSGPFTPSGTRVHTADRWYTNNTNDTISVNSNSISDAGRTQIGDESATNQVQIVFTGSATAGSGSWFSQRLEGTRRFSGKTVTVSFWGLAQSAGLKVGIAMSYATGTGGGTPPTINGQAVTLATTWARYSVQFAMPSLSGVTVGTAGTDFTELDFYLSAQGSRPDAGNIGVQSGTIQLWGVQLEIGTQATPLDAGGTPQQILAQCQRFYCLTSTRIDAATPPGAYGVSCSIALPVWMRASPTLTQTANGSSNVSGITYAAQNAGVVTVSGATGSGGGSYAIVVGFSASADL